MQTSLERVSGVIGELYDAVETPEGFTEVLCSIRRLLNGTSGILFTPLHDPSDGGFGFVDHFDTSFYTRYRERYCTQDPWAREAQRKGYVRTGLVVTNEMLLSDRDLQKDPFYYEGHIPMDVIRTCSSVVTDGEDPTFPMTFLSIYRGIGSKSFVDEEVAILKLLTPHVLRALRLARSVMRSNAYVGATRDMLQTLECGVILLDGKGHILFMNEAAEELCKHARGLTTRVGRSQGELSLAAVAGREDAMLQETISGVLAGRISMPNESSGSIVIRGGRGTETLLVTALPPPPRLNDLEAMQARVLLLIEDPSQPQAIGERVLAALFGLTPAECRVALGLVSGVQPKAIALRLSVSENTVRTHIRSIHAKTDTSNMIALVTLLARVANTQASKRLANEASSGKGAAPTNRDHL